MKQRTSKQRRTSPPEAPSRREWPAWWVAGGLALLALLAFANSFSNPFVLDDISGIAQNEYIRSLTPLSRALSAPVQSVAAGRPLLALSLALNYAWGGLDPAGYHAFNLLVHWAAALTLFGCIRRGLALPGIPEALARLRSPLAAAVAAIWLVHPLQAEVVNYVVQRSESLMGLFYFLTIYAMLRGQTPERAFRGLTPWTFVAIAACALGMATKESMVTAPVVVLLLDVLFVTGSLAGALRARGALYAGLAATWGLLATLIANGPRSHSAGFASGVSVQTYLFNQAWVIVNYLRLAIWPYPLVADYGVTTPITFAQAAAPGALVLSLLALTVWALWKAPRVGFLGAFFFITLAPTSSIVPIATEVAAERRMYLPLAAVLLLLALALLRLTATGAVVAAGAGRRRALLAVSGMLIVAFTGLSFARNRDYRDPVILWNDVLAHHPNGRVHYTLGLELKARGDTAGALEHYRAAALAGHAEAHYALGFELDARGETAAALDEYRTFVRLAGEDYRVPNTWVLIGRALMQQGALPDAETAFRTTLSMQPRHGDALGGLADALMAQQRFSEAVAAYSAFLQVDPANAIARENLRRAQELANYRATVAAPVR